MPHRTRCCLRLCVALLVGTAAACGSDSPSKPTPTPTPTPTPAPTVTGVWDLTFAQIPAKGVLTLTESSGSVTGTLQIVDEPGSGTLSGTISASGAMTLVGTEPAGDPATFQVTVDSARRSFTGALRIRPPSGGGADLTVTGTKR